jgi:hypothetical protein
MDANTILAILAQQAAPGAAPTFAKVVTVPGALALVGLVLFLAPYRKSVSLRKSLPLRHLGTLLVVVALVTSFRTFWLLTDKDTGALYRSEIQSRYTLFAHYALPAGLLILLVAIGAAELYLNKLLPNRPA